MPDLRVHATHHIVAPSVSNASERGSPRDYVPYTVGWARFHDFLCLFPEFPETPWLDIREIDRAKRLQILKARAHRWRPVESVNDAEFDFPKPIQQPHEHGGCYWPGGLEALAAYRSREITDSGFNHFLRIDWLRTDDQIASAFRTWLKESRPQDYFMYQHEGSPIYGLTAFKRALKYVGAHIVVQRVDSGEYPKLLLKDAIDGISISKEGYDQCLFSGGKELRAASSLIKPYLRSFEPEYLLYRHREVSIEELPDFHFSSFVEAYTITEEKNTFVGFQRKSWPKTSPICRSRG